MIESIAPWRSGKGFFAKIAGRECYAFGKLGFTNGDKVTAILAPGTGEFSRMKEIQEITGDVVGKDSEREEALADAKRESEIVSGTEKERLKWAINTTLEAMRETTTDCLFNADNITSVVCTLYINALKR